MLRASLVFFSLGLIALGLGAYDVAGISLELGRVILFVFLGLAILTFLGALLSGRASQSPRLFISGILTVSLLGYSALSLMGVHAVLSF